METGAVNDWKVFYSWQSDLHNSIKRGFIQDALERAAKAIRQDDSIKVEPVIDRDTAGVPGSPDIANTIFEKIEGSQVFACDVSIINGDDKARPTPNPNVLIELGYSYKALTSERILMIMNTAFGEPKLLPFDLSKKRVITYQLAPKEEAKAAVRKELVQKLENALRTIVSRMDDVLVRGEISGDKERLKEECEEVLASGDSREWRMLVDNNGRTIIEKILDWKERGERAAHKGGEEWESAVLEVAEICLPGFVPILTAIDKGKKKFWHESIRTLRKLSILEERMDGGATWVLNIGARMLHVAGSLGYALAVQTKQLDFVNEWMLLPMPNPDSNQHEETDWAEVLSAHRLPKGIGIDYRDPFRLILKICESDYVASFFPNKEILAKEYLFLVNLLQSLVELRLCIEKEDTRKTLEEKGKLLFDVWPVWCLMESEDFKEGTWDLFGSSKGVLDFVFPHDTSVTLDKFWRWWKNWKYLCSDAWNTYFIQSGKFSDVDWKIQWMFLPGEPIEEREE